MNTLFELLKNGTVWVFHSTDGGAWKQDHPIGEPCEHCPANVRRKYGTAPVADHPRGDRPVV
jgi:hypothetical protein